MTQTDVATVDEFMLGGGNILDDCVIESHHDGEGNKARRLRQSDLRERRPRTRMGESGSLLLTRC